MNAKKLAKGLGWFSLALGAAEMAMPGRLGRMIGVRANRPLMRALGARELLSGAGILARRKPKNWMWSRVAGDAMDLALMGTAFAVRPRSKAKLGAAMGAVAGVTLLDVLGARRLSR